MKIDWLWLYHFMFWLNPSKDLFKYSYIIITLIWSSNRDTELWKSFRFSMGPVLTSLSCQWPQNLTSSPLAAFQKDKGMIHPCTFPAGAFSHDLRDYVEGHDSANFPISSPFWRLYCKTWGHFRSTTCFLVIREFPPHEAVVSAQLSNRGSRQLPRDSETFRGPLNFLCGI